ncbi:MAG: ABC transporter permease subunit, partial [Defluviitaleaceae bacterium]|nr:ABC transporter permease subunit [Defluviitaleaceae bacterium]
KALYILFLPAFNAIKAIPVVSFTILAIMWVESLNLSLSFFIAFITVLPIVYFNTYEGIKNTDAKLLEMSKVFVVSYKKIILHVYVPSVLPYVVSAAASGIGFAFKAGVAAELIGRVNHTIGFNLQIARNFLQMSDLLAWTIAIVLLSYMMEKFFLLLLKGVEKWH